MAKAKKAMIKKARQSLQLPLDDMRRWRPVAEIIEGLSPHIGNKKLIAEDLTAALASGEIHCMRRHANERALKIDKLSNAELGSIVSRNIVVEDQPTGHRELVPASFWVDYCFARSPNGDICVGFRLPPNHDGFSELSFTWTANWVFYLWRPDCVRKWPELTPQAAAKREGEASEPPSHRRKPGRKPRGNWKLEVATEVGLRYREGKPPPAANELAQFCEDKLGFQPDISEIQKWLRLLVG
jgi:hypothetical protein